MKKILQLSFVFFLFSVIISNAQLKDVYQKGWIIKNDNTKTEGYIKLENLTKTSSRICFKENIDDQDFQFYKTSQIKSFKRRENENFRLLNIKINNNRDEISVFGNLILQGKISIYKSIYNNIVFYVLERDNQFFVLQNDTIIEDQGKYARYNYIGILNLATELQFSQKDINVDFNESNFIEIVKKYNTNNNSESQEFKTINKKTKYFIIDGGGLNGFNNFYGQVNHRTFFPEIGNNVSLNIGLGYINEELTKDIGREKTKDYHQSMFSVPVTLQKYFLNNQFKPYLFLGGALSYLTLHNADELDILEDEANSAFGIGFLYGAGLDFEVYKKIFLKLEYRGVSTSIKGSTYSGIPKGVILFGVGYHFIK